MLDFDVLTSGPNKFTVAPGSETYLICRLEDEDSMQSNMTVPGDEELPAGSVDILSHCKLVPSDFACLV